MELKSLFLGLFFSMGLFAVKSGMGLNCFFLRQNKPKAKCLFFILFVLAYLALFVASAWAIRRVDIPGTGHSFVKLGMFIHCLLAGLFMLWGTGLLKNGEKGRGTSRGWALLVTPCPVCMTVIFFTAAFLIAYFPGAGNWAVISAWAAFVAVALASAVFMARVSGGNASPESILGVCMAAIAGYFALSVVVMPQFADLSEIYTLAKYKGDERILSLRHVYLSAGMFLLFFAAGGGGQNQTATA